MRIYLKKIFKLFPEHPSWRLLTSTLRMTIYQPILPICWHLLLTGIFGFFRKYSASFGNIRLLSEKSAYFGNIRLPSETFGFFRKNSDPFGNIRFPKVFPLVVNSHVYLPEKYRFKSEGRMKWGQKFVQFDVQIHFQKEFQLIVQLENSWLVQKL